MVVVTGTASSPGSPVTAYPGVTYNADVQLLFSEIDPVQNTAVSTAVNTAGFSETKVWSGQPDHCGNPASAPASLSSSEAVGPSASQRYRQNRVAARAHQYYALTWGVDSLTVRSAESGEIIRFSYRVLDAEKADALNDKTSEPSLIDPKAGVKLVVHSLEKVGKLRQSSTPQAGKMYWMAFSN